MAVTAMLGLAAFSFLTALTLDGTDREVFGQAWADGRWLYAASGVLALATIVLPRARPVWLLVMSTTTWGRAVTLLLVGGSTERQAVRADHVVRVRGALGWVLIWLLGILAVLVLEAAAVLRARGDG